MAATGMVHIRVDRKVKTKAAKTLAAMGLTVSDAVRLLLTRIASEQALPFEVRVPNRETVAAMEAGERGEVARAASVAAMMADLNAQPRSGGMKLGGGASPRSSGRRD